MARGRSTEIISTIKWIRTRKLSTKNCLSAPPDSRSLFSPAERRCPRTCVVGLNVLVSLNGQTHIGLCRNDNLLPRFVFFAFRDWERSVSWKGVGMQREFIWFRVPGSGIRDPSFGFRISGSGFRVSGFGFQISGSEIRGLSFGFRVSDFWCRLSGFGCTWPRGARRRRTARRPCVLAGTHSGPQGRPALQSNQSHLTESVDNVILQKSILAQIRQRIVYISNDKGYVDGFGFCKTTSQSLWVI